MQHKRENPDISTSEMICGLNFAEMGQLQKFPIENSIEFTYEANSAFCLSNVGLNQM